MLSAISLGVRHGEAPCEWVVTGRVAIVRVATVRVSTTEAKMMDYEGRPAPDEYAPHYAPYIARVPEGGLVEILERQIEGTRRLLAGLTETEAEHAYAPGKWTIKEVVGHITDTERVFSYRALRIGRGDTTELPGFDENLYAPAGAFGARTLVNLLDEFVAVRQATIWLLGTLPAEAWPRRGVASGQVISVRALACNIAGHELHHRAILEERYLVRQVAGE